MAPPKNLTTGRTLFLNEQLSKALLGRNNAGALPVLRHVVRKDFTCCRYLDGVLRNS